MLTPKKITTVFVISLALLTVFFLFKPAEFFLNLIAKQFVEGTSSGKTLFLLLYTAFFSAITVILSENKNAQKKLQKYGLFAFKVVIISGLAAIFLSLFMQLFIQYSIGAEQGSYIAAIATNDGVTNWEMSYLEHNHITKSAIFLLLSTIFVDFKNFDTGYPFYVNIPGIFFWDIMLLALVFVFFTSSFVFINLKLQTISLFDYILWILISAISITVFFDGGLFSHPFRIAVGLLTLFIVRNFEFTNLQKLNDTYLKVLAPFSSTAIVCFISFFITGAEPITAFFVSAPIIGLFTGYSFVFDKKTNNTDIKPLNFMKILAVVILLCSVFSLTYGLYNASNGLEVKNTWLFIYGFPEGTTEQALMQTLEPFSVKEIKLDGWLASIHVQSTEPVKLKEIEQALETKFKPQGYLDVMEREKMYGKLNYSVFSINPNQENFILLKKNSIIENKNETYFGNENYTVVWTTSKPENLNEKLGKTIFGAKINSIDNSEPLKTIININMGGSPTWGLIAIATHINNISDRQRFLLWVNPKNTQNLGDINE